MCILVLAQKNQKYVLRQHRTQKNIEIAEPKKLKLG